MTVRNSLNDIIQFNYQNGYRNEYLFSVELQIIKLSDHQIEKKYSSFYAYIKPKLIEVRNYYNQLLYNNLIDFQINLPFDIFFSRNACCIIFFSLSQRTNLFSKC